jgi:hypothetical protein
MVSDDRFAQLIEAGKSDSLVRDAALLSLLDDLSKALLTRTKVRGRVMRAAFVK